MPKVRETRKQKATELLQRLVRGPSFDDPAHYSRGRKEWDDPEHGFSAQYKIWASTWVIPLVNELVPELRKKDKPHDDTKTGS